MNLEVGKHVAVKLDAACHIENGDIIASLDAKRGVSTEY